MKRQKSIEEKIIFGVFKAIAWPFKVLFRGRGKIQRRQAGVIDIEMTRGKWRNIQELVKLGGESRLRSAVFEADKLLDYTLREKGFKGETMGERLKDSKEKLSYSSYDAAWKAHKIRNKYAHEMESDVLFFEVKEGIKNYEKVLSELGVI